jgi:hypothetical protein
MVAVVRAPAIEAAARSIVTDLAGNAVASATVGTFSVTAGESTTGVSGPTVVGAPLIAKHKGALSEITLTFSESMNLSSVTNISNYTLLDAGSSHIFGIGGQLLNASSSEAPGANVVSPFGRCESGVESRIAAGPSGGGAS